MLAQKSKSKFSVDLVPEDPVFCAQYLGKMEIASFRKREMIISAIEMLVKRGVNVNHGNLPRVSMTFNSFGIYMIDTSSGKPDAKYEFGFRLCDISNCLANRGMKRIFAWVVTDPSGQKKPRVHAVLCGNEDVAKIMALLMTEYFNIAYKDHKVAEGKKRRQRKLNHRLEGLRLHQSMDETSMSRDEEKSEKERMYTKNKESHAGAHMQQLLPPKARPRPRLPMLDPNSECHPSWLSPSSAATLLGRSKSTSAADSLQPPERTSSFSHQMVRERHYRQAFNYDPDTSDAKSIKDACNTLRRLKVNPDKWEDRTEVDSLFNWVDDEQT
ncbi:hypothetical protein HOLleu_27960 [Holothuria leucospilota]|uniref:PID domain-containing protein n=1 Tax=Holothuria leucospilota TaxID=206669 RepID=A0A9Q1BQN1_HOLLE|nr:hypothetical protein HOLleu_27960 [Holothuria leucospilota]